MPGLSQILPSVGTVVGVVLALAVVRRLLERYEAKAGGGKFRNQLIMAFLTLAGVLVIILVIPIGPTRQGQIIGLIGALLSATIALSSTTVLGNAMAGIMMRAVRNFRTGDFIRTGEHFGRVSERGLFHTEIQTEDRELTTIPNLYLVTHPVTTVRTSGTVVSTAVSLGYDVPRGRVAALLTEAAERAGLSEPFVHVRELGDFSVTYRVAGLLTEIKRLLSTRSRLNECVLDSLHGGGVEIVSPNFMNTRALDPRAAVIPRQAAAAEPAEPVAETAPEEVVFDKAEEAESLESLRQADARLADEIEEQQRLVKEAAEGVERDRLAEQLSQLELRRARLAARIAAQEATADAAD